MAEEASWWCFPGKCGVLKLGFGESTCESLWKMFLLQFESLFIGKDGYVAQKGKIHFDVNL